MERGDAIFSALGHAASYYSGPLMIRLLDEAMAWGIAETGQNRSAAPCHFARQMDLRFILNVPGNRRIWSSPTGR